MKPEPHMPVLPLKFTNGNVIDSAGEPFIGTDENWKRVVRAVNMHESLLGALYQCQDYFEKQFVSAMLKIVNQAIAEAEIKP